MYKNFHNDNLQILPVKCNKKERARAFVRTLSIRENMKKVRVCFVCAGDFPHFRTLIIYAECVICMNGI